MKLQSVLACLPRLIAALLIALTFEVVRPASAIDGQTGLGPVWSTYLGGTPDTPLDNDYAVGVAIDKEGNIFIAGNTCSGGWVSGGYDTTYDGNGDMWGDGFLAKFSPSGQHLWSTYLGGNNRDVATAIAIDGEGNIYIVGHTDSEGWISGGFDTELDTSLGLSEFGYYYSDAFVMKFSNDGIPQWSTYLGGAAPEHGIGIALDAAGNVYAVGWTQSEGWIPGGYSNQYNFDGFVVKLTADGAFVWSTYVGGQGSDYCYGVAVDAAGNVVVCGDTTSVGWVSGGYDTSFGGSPGLPQDGFVAKLTPDGVPLWSTYLGGDEFDHALGIATDGQCNIYVSGSTESAGWVAGGVNTIYHGGNDAFLVKLSSDGNHLWSNYLGDSAVDNGGRCAVDAAGYVYLAGNAWDGSWLNRWMPSALLGGHSVFLARFTPGGTRLLWAYALGGHNEDYTGGLAQDNAGNIYVAGGTDSPGWTSGSWDSTLAGYQDGFLLKFIDEVGSLRVTVSPPAAVAGGARWRRVGTGAWHENGDIEEFIPAGGCAVEFNDLTGWVKPANQMVSIAKDTTATLSVSYALDVGSLSVTIEPAQAAAGARWRRVGTTTWLGSGGTEAGVPSGDWFVEFNDVAGWDKPVARDCTVKFNQTTRLTVYYAPSALNAADPKVWTLYE